MRAFLRALLACALLALPASAETVSEIVAAHAADIEKPSRTTIGPVIDALAASGDPMAAKLLEAWGNKTLGIRKSDKQFFFLTADPAGYALTDLTGAPVGTAAKSDITDLKPNAGVRGLIASSLVAFTLSDPDPLKRAAALESIAQDPNAASLAPLRVSIDTEADPILKAQKQRLECLLTLRFDEDKAARIAAISSFGADLGIDLRGALSPLVATTQIALDSAPTTQNIAKQLIVGKDISPAAAYDLLVADGSAPARLSHDEQRTDLARISKAAP